MKKDIRILSGLVFMAVCLPSAALQPGPVSPAAKHPLWRVEGKQNSVYLLGSVHFLKITDYPLPAVVQEVFSNAPIAVFETDLAQLQQPQEQQELVDKARLPAGVSLRGALSSSTYERFRQCLLINGLPLDIFDKLKPSIVAITLELLKMEQAGFSPDYGVDQYLFERAQEQRKTILSLESVESQINLLTELSRPQGEFLMQTTLDTLDQTKESLNRIVQAWRTGNVAALEHLLLAGLAKDPELLNQMVTARNHRWVPRIEELLDGEEDAIVIVGAGHLVGNQGLLALLRSRGWTVTQQ